MAGVGEAAAAVQRDTQSYRWVPRDAAASQYRSRQARTLSPVPLGETPCASSRATTAAPTTSTAWRSSVTATLGSGSGATGVDRAGQVALSRVLQSYDCSSASRLISMVHCRLVAGAMAGTGAGGTKLWPGPQPSSQARIRRFLAVESHGGVPTTR